MRNAETRQLDVVVLAIDPNVGRLDIAVEELLALDSVQRGSNSMQNRAGFLQWQWPLFLAGRRAFRLSGKAVTT
jgi:hypothetical protein